MSRPAISGFFWKLFVDRMIAGKGCRILIAVKFKTSVPRSILRAVATVSHSRTAAVVAEGEHPAELGDFARSAPSPKGLLRGGKVPPWLEKITERFPLELLQQRTGTQHNAQGPSGSGPQAGQSVAGGDELDRVIAELNRELELRAGLIREQWAIRGPGLLAALTRQPGFKLPNQELEVELVLPLDGGAAELDISGNAWMEALLHDVSFQFPETLRLGWLVARAGSNSVEAAVQMLLNAAAEVDWLSPDPTTEAELRRWLGISPPESPCISPDQAPPGNKTR